MTIVALMTAMVLKSIVVLEFFFMLSSKVYWVHNLGKYPINHVHCNGTWTTVVVVELISCLKCTQ